MIAEHYLKKVGDQLRGVSHASSLQAARGVLDTEGADLVLLDLTLPDSGMDATLAALGSLTRNYEASFVALSSLGTEDVARAALDNGASAFLAKQDINAASLTTLLDDLDPARLPNPEVQIPEAAPEAIADPGQLTSKIAHDALGWAANISFRATAMAADPALQASESLQASLASIQSSAAALASFISGARAVVLHELESQAGDLDETEVLELAPWLELVAERWRKSTRNKRLEVQFAVASGVSVPAGRGPRLLGQAIVTLLQNATQHAARTDGAIKLRVQEVPSDGPQVLLDVTDDGGPWTLHDATALGAPLCTGKKKAASAGLGLFTACRTLESLGGEMTFHRRDDATGAYAIRIALPRA